MAINIKVGDLVDLAQMKHGTTDKGTWCLVPVVENRRRMTIWVENADEASKFVNKAKVKEILSVKYGARKDNNGEWQNDYSTTVILERPNDADVFASGGFADAVLEQEEFPFN